MPFGEGYSSREEKRNRNLCAINSQLSLIDTKQDAQAKQENELTSVHIEHKKHSNLPVISFKNENN